MNMQEILMQYLQQRQSGGPPPGPQSFGELPQPMRQDANRQGLFALAAGIGGQPAGYLGSGLAQGGMAMEQTRQGALQGYQERQQQERQQQEAEMARRAEIAAMIDDMQYRQKTDERSIEQTEYERRQAEIDRARQAELDRIAEEQRGFENQMDRDKYQQEDRRMDTYAGMNQPSLRVSEENGFRVTRDPRTDEVISRTPIFDDAERRRQEIRESIAAKMISTQGFVDREALDSAVRAIEGDGDVRYVPREDGKRVLRVDASPAYSPPPGQPVQITPKPEVLDESGGPAPAGPTGLSPQGPASPIEAVKNGLPAEIRATLGPDDDADIAAQLATGIPVKDLIRMAIQQYQLEMGNQR